MGAAPKFLPWESWQARSGRPWLMLRRPHSRNRLQRSRQPTRRTWKHSRLRVVWLERGGRRKKRRSRSWQESGPRRPTRPQTSRRNHRPPTGCGWVRIVLLSPKRSEQISSKSPSLLARDGRHFPRRQKHPSRRQLPSSRLPTLRLWRNTKRQLVMLVATTKTRRVPRSSEDAEVEAEASNRQRSSCSHCFLLHDHS